MPAGSAAKAASVGANTVYGPLPWSVSTRPAALTAAKSVVNEPRLGGDLDNVLRPWRADEGAVLGAVVGAVVGTAVAVGAVVGAALGDAALEQAAIAMASAGTRRAMDRFMAG